MSLLSMSTLKLFVVDKSGVRAMDAVTEFLTSDSAPQEIQDANVNPTKWAVAGASKVGFET